MTDVRKAREAAIRAAFANGRPVGGGDGQTYETPQLTPDLINRAIDAYEAALASEQVGEEEIAVIVRDMQNCGLQFGERRAFCDDAQAHPAARYDYCDCKATARAILSRLSLREGVKIPDGWKLVPIEPTTDQIDGMALGTRPAISFDEAREIYSAALRAAPLPSTPTDRKG
jgi:hypothetical protein